MKINEKSKVIRVSNSKLTKEEYSTLYIPKNGIRKPNRVVKYEGKYFSCKSGKLIINELIGSYLAKKIKLNAVDNQIGIDDYGFLTLSELFFDSRYTYYHLAKFNNRLLFELHHCSNPYNLFYLFFMYLDRISKLNEVEKETLLKLIALDLKMGQNDRTSTSNLMFKKNNQTGEESFAPIYDFGDTYFPYVHSYYDNFYDNPYLIIRKHPLSLGHLIRKYPDIIPSVEILKNIPMEQVLADIEAEKQIEFAAQEKEFFIIRDESYCRVLKQI